jgi:hypothetical protein
LKNLSIVGAIDELFNRLSPSGQSFVASELNATINVKRGRKAKSAKRGGTLLPQPPIRRRRRRRKTAKPQV